MCNFKIILNAEGWQMFQTLIKCAYCKNSVDTCKHFIRHVKMLHGEEICLQKKNIKLWTACGASRICISGQMFWKISTLQSGQENRTKWGALHPHIPDNCSYKDTRQLTPKCAKFVCAMCLGLLAPEVIMEIVQLEAEKCAKIPQPLEYNNNWIWKIGIT